MKITRAKLIQAIVFVTFLWGTSLLAQFDVGVVMPFENDSHDTKLDWIGESFVEVLSSTLASPRFMMLDRRERTAAFDSLGIPSTSILSDATIYKVARTMDATKLIMGRYQYADGVFKTSARVMDMDGPTLSGEFTESGPLADLMKLQTGLAWQILHFLRPALPVSKSEFLADHPGARIDAFENYLRGITTKNRADQIKYLRNALRLDPQFTTPALELGLVYFHDHDYPTSILWLSKLHRGDDDYLEANYFLGLAFLYQEQYERSAAALRVVAQQLPLNEVYNNLGIALLREDKPGATAYFEKAIESNPSDTDYQFNLGYALWQRGDFPQAIPHLRKAVQGDPRPDWRAVYVLCLEKAGQSEEAARQQKLLQQQSPEWSQVKDPQRLQKLERPKDNYDGASLRQLQMLIDVQTESKHAKLPIREHVALHYKQAQSLLDQGYDREAAEQLQEAIDYDPNYVDAYVQLGKIYVKSGRFEEAIRALNHALQLKENAASYLLIAKVYLEQGKLDEAQAQVNSALRLEPSNAEAVIFSQELAAKNVARQ